MPLAETLPVHFSTDMERIDHLLPWGHLGCERQLESVLRFGSGERSASISRPACTPMNCLGMRAALGTESALWRWKQQGALNGVIELLLAANPMGLGQLLQGSYQGFGRQRQNFNRDFVELARAVPSCCKASW